MKISIYIRNKEDGASYYRLYQYSSKFMEHYKCVNYREFTNRFLQSAIRKSDGIKFMRVLISALAYFIGVNRRIYQLFIDIFIFRPDVVLIQREIFPRHIPLLGEILIKYIGNNSKMIWDFDDNICYTGEISASEKEIYEKYADFIVIPNCFLKKSLSKKVYDRIVITPTTDNDLEAIDWSIIRLKRNITFRNEIRILWVGTYANLKYVSKIVSILDKAAGEIELRNNKKVILNIVCNKDLIIETKHLEIENTRWSRFKAIEALKRAHVGIMPLEKDEVTLGKAGFKAVQYLGSAIPAIISPVGFNNTVIEEGVSGFFASHDDTWGTSLKKIVMDEALYIAMSIAARERWIKVFSSNNVFDTYVSLIDGNRDKDI